MHNKQQYFPGQTLTHRTNCSSSSVESLIVIVSEYRPFTIPFLCLHVDQVMVSELLTTKRHDYSFTKFGANRLGKNTVRALTKMVLQKGDSYQWPG